MIRPWMSSMAFALGLASCLLWSAARAQEAKPAQAQPGGNVKNGHEGHGHGIENALQSYESFRNRSGDNGEQVCKEIAQLADKLAELTKLRAQLAIAVAESKAHAQESKGNPQAAQKPASLAVSPGEGGDVRTRELKAVYEQFQTEFNQAQGQADQLAAQLKSQHDAQNKAHAATPSSRPANVEEKPVPKPPARAAVNDPGE